MSEKILVMGPGRSGTTFIWALLRELGYTTEPEGYENRPMFEIMRYPDVMERLEKGEVEWPQVIKHLGGFCYNLNEHIDNYGWKVKHVFFCLRKLDRLTERFFEEDKVGHKLLNLSIKETSLLTEEEKEARLRYILQEEVGAGMFNLIERDHPFTVVRFPSSITDPEYCYKRMETVLSEVWFPEFKDKWEVARTKWGKNVKERHYEEENV